MTPTSAPGLPIRMGDSLSFTPSPGSSSSSATAAALSYTLAVCAPHHTPSESSEHGFASHESRPDSGEQHEPPDLGGDDGQSDKIACGLVHSASSPIHDFQRANALRAFGFSVGTEPRLEQHHSFSPPSPSTLVTPRTISRPRSGPGRTQHPLEPIPGAPPPTLHKAKGPWHKAEDVSLMYWVSHLGTGKWVEIARRVGSRTGKQCRERWTNQLSPDSRSHAFSFGVWFGGKTWLANLIDALVS